MKITKIAISPQRVTDAYWFPEAGAKLRFSFRTIFMAVFQLKELLKYILYNYKYQNL